MNFRSTKVRASITCAALVVVLAACGAPGPGPAAPDPAQDLLKALPTPMSAPPTTTVPPTTSAAPTTTTKPKQPKAPRAPGASKAPAAAKPASAPAGPGPGWRRVSGDEFDASALDASSWLAYNGEGGFGNGLRRPQAISQSDGTLKITAKGEVSGGMRHTFGQVHGRWEFRARTERGRGLGSAILLWPDSNEFPRDGELDIMEVPSENRDKAHVVVHWGEENNIHGTSIPGDFTQWHTFAMEWLPDRVTWYVDGVKQYENTDKAAIPTTPMHLAIQLDRGPVKDWLPDPDETTPEKVSLEVDWVRVYAKE